MTAFGSWRESTTGAACLAVALTACAVAAAAQSQELVDVREALTLAQGEYLTGDHQRALDRLEAVLASPATAGQRLEAFVLRARCLVQQGEVEKARKSFGEALALDPTWNPDSEDLTTAEMALAREEQSAFRERQRILGLPACPGSTAPLVSTAVFTVSSVLLLIARGDANERWDEYEAVGAHPDDLYDAYSRAKDKQDAAMVATVATGIVSGYLWYRYIDGRHECRRSAQDDSAVRLMLGPREVAVAWRF